jgi:hypothetical protein
MTPAHGSCAVGSAAANPSIVISSQSSHSDAPDQRRGERRSGAERCLAVLPFRLDQRAGADRRSGADRRIASLTPGDQLQLALELLAQVAEAHVMDDDGLRQLDGAILRVRAALERITPSGAAR